MKQIDTQTIHHEIDSLDSSQLEQVGNFIGYLKSLPTENQQTKLQSIKERLERSANSGKNIPLETAFAKVEELHQTYMAKKWVVASNCVFKHEYQFQTQPY